MILLKYYIVIIYLIPAPGPAITNITNDLSINNNYFKNYNYHVFYL